MTSEIIYSLVTGLVAAIVGAVGAFVEKKRKGKRSLLGVYVSLLLFVVFFSLANIFLEIRTVSKQVDSVSEVFGAGADDDLEKIFVDLYMHHHELFGQNRHLRSWSLAALRRLLDDFKAGEITMDPDRAVAVMGRTIFASAEEYVFASNVGSVTPFLEDPTYASENSKAWTERKVIVIRFYLYSRMTNPHKTFDQFKAQIGGTDESPGLHDRLLTTYSAAINLDYHPGVEPLDLLLVDNSIMGQMKIDTSGNHVLGLASIRRLRLNTTRNYFSKLFALTGGKNVAEFGMEMDKIQEKENLPIRPGKDWDKIKLAREITVHYAGQLQEERSK